MHLRLPNARYCMRVIGCCYNTKHCLGSCDVSCLQDRPLSWPVSTTSAAAAGRLDPPACCVHVLKYFAGTLQSKPKHVKYVSKYFFGKYVPKYFFGTLESKPKLVKYVSKYFFGKLEPKHICRGQLNLNQNMSKMSQNISLGRLNQTITCQTCPKIFLWDAWT